MILSFSLIHRADKRVTGFETQIQTLTKIHTLRIDQKKRWRVGMPVHFWIGSPRVKGSYPFYIDYTRQNIRDFIPIWHPDPDKGLIPKMYAIEEVTVTRPTRPRFIPVKGQLFGRKVKQWMRVNIGGLELTQHEAHDFAARDGLGLDRLETFLFHKTKETELNLRLLHWTNKMVYNENEAEIHQEETANK